MLRNPDRDGRPLMAWDLPFTVHDARRDDLPEWARCTRRSAARRTAGAPDGDLTDGDVPDSDLPDSDVPDGDVPDSAPEP